MHTYALSVRLDGSRRTLLTKTPSDM